VSQSQQAGTQTPEAGGIERVSGLGRPPADAPMLPCQVCGRGPTAVISVSRNLGMVIFRRYWTYHAPLCRDHGSQLARNWLAATLLMGWWGIISFFTNFGAIATDLRALSSARRLAPAGSVIVPGGFGMAGQASAPALPNVPRIQLAAVAAGIVVVVVVAYLSATYGSKSVGDLVVGDCFDDPTGTAVISEVPHRPCSEAHGAEVFDVVAYSAGQGTYPTDAEFQAFVSAQCIPAFNTYTGGGGGLAATVDIGFLTPTSDGWSSGDRTVICYLAAPAGQTLSQSLRSSSQ